MPYFYARHKVDYSHFASGRVLVNLPGAPSFPVRLASEVFLRLLALRGGQSLAGSVHLFDPCCGSAYHLVALGLLHRDRIAAITACDILPSALETAGRNLALLTCAGMQARLSRLQVLFDQFAKQSHARAVESAHVLLNQVQAQEATHPLPTHLFQADAFDQQALFNGLKDKPVDMVFSDLPYGYSSQWLGLASAHFDPISALLDSLAHALPSNTLIALATLKDAKPQHPSYVSLGKIKLGKRLITLLRLG